MRLCIFCNSHKLTNRESEIVDCLSSGIVETVDLIDKLGIAHNTLNNHLKNIFRKMKITCKSELLGLLVLHYKKNQDFQ